RVVLRSRRPSRLEPRVRQVELSRDDVLRDAGCIRTLRRDHEEPQDRGIDQHHTDRDCDLRAPRETGDLRLHDPAPGRRFAAIVNVTIAFCFGCFLAFAAGVVPASAVSAAGATRALVASCTSSSEGSAAKRAKTRATEAFEYVAPWIVTPCAPD